MKLPQWIQRRLPPVLGGGRGVGLDRGRAGAVLAVMAAALAGCAGAPGNWRADTVPLATAPLEAASARRAPCPALDPAITAESRRVTPIASAAELNALTASLIGPEAAKNASLTRVVRAYEKCRLGAAQ
jgi:hypothetical protein